MRAPTNLRLPADFAATGSPAGTSTGRATGEGQLGRQGGGVTNAAQAPDAGGRELRPGEKALVLFLDPVSLVVAMPPLPGGEVALAQFCRLLARVARQLAAASHHGPGQAITTSGES